MERKKVFFLWNTFRDVQLTISEKVYRRIRGYRIIWWVIRGRIREQLPVSSTKVK